MSVKLKFFAIMYTMTILSPRTHLDGCEDSYLTIIASLGMEVYNSPLKFKELHM